MARQLEKKKMGNFDMTSAADRILQFREDFSNGKIATLKTEEEGFKVFKSYIWKDKKQLVELLSKGIPLVDAYGSADSEGTARMNPEKNKDFEKLETISVGRALAFLGYNKDGQIASTEELEEFEAHKDNKIKEERALAKEQLIDNMKACKDIESLREMYTKSGFTNDADVQSIKDDLKDKLSAAAQKKAAKGPKIKKVVV